MDLMKMTRFIYYSLLIFSPVVRAHESFRSQDQSSIVYEHNHAYHCHRPVFSLTYNISVNGIYCGKMQFELKEDEENPGLFQAWQKWKSQILFFDLDQEETLYFTRDPHKLLPISYTFQRVKSGNQKLYTYYFSEKQQQEGVKDRLSLQLMFIDNLAQNIDVHDSPVGIVDDRGDYKIIPKISVDKPLVEVKFNFKNRDHLIVYDAQHHYLPIRFTQTRGAITFEGRLKESDVDEERWWYPQKP